ncbi:MAG: DUF4105 domain-containing protein [Candidatus Muiribacteriaceae bacterium]
MKKTISLMILLVTVLTIITTAEEFQPWQRTVGFVDKTGPVFTLDNVRWGFRQDNLRRPIYRRTVFNIEKIESVYYLSQHFGDLPQMQHGMLYFKFSEKEACTTSNKSDWDIGLILTVDGRLRKNQDSMDFDQSVSNRYPLIYMMTTFSDRLQKAEIVGNDIDEYKLNLNSRQRALLLQNCVLRSLQYGNEYYNLISNNCVVNACRMIDTVLSYDNKLHFTTVAGQPNPNIWSPERTYRTLIRHGIAQLKSRIYRQGQFYSERMADNTIYIFNPIDRIRSEYEQISDNDRGVNGIYAELDYYKALMDEFRKMNNVEKAAFYSIFSDIRSDLSELVVERSESMDIEKLNRWYIQNEGDSRQELSVLRELFNTRLY